MKPLVVALFGLASLTAEGGSEPSAPADRAPLQIAQVTAEGPVPLFEANCFKLSAAGKLEEQAYSNCPVGSSILFMKSGDTVIELYRDKGYVAVDRPRANGWGIFMMRPSDLRVIETKSHPASEWTGLWRYGDHYARITLDGGNLKVQTDLFSGEGRLEGDWLTIRDRDCKAVFSRVGRWLYALPGSECGYFTNLLWRDEDLKRMGALGAASALGRPQPSARDE